MKKLFFLLILLIGNVNSKANKYEMQDYIQFQFTGPEEYSSKQLFIVKRSVDFQTIENRLNELGLHSNHELTQKEKELFWERMFNTIITDERTFSKLTEFVNKRSIFFSFKKHSEINIITNGLRHPIIKDSQKQFFSELGKYLVSEDCDTVVINQIKAYNK